MSKIKSVVISIVCFLALSSFACDATKALEGSIDITLQPGVPHIETWDFTDCGFGITSDSFYVTKPRNHNGTQQDLPPGTPLTVTIYDVTADVTYGPAFSFFCLNACNSVCGHILQMTLTLSANAHKSLDVEITQVANWGGLCQ